VNEESEASECMTTYCTDFGVARKEIGWLFWFVWCFG
jgi:hypothetical protein